ncbi:MAG TPA: histidine kinase dimerization/phospho-acceptor domain-containing protein [Terriglobales bacterium]|nr:histidine kinase dimerization/phospho-acceptor domain-containing protein [Terriglobales bacterium]
MPGLTANRLQVVGIYAHEINNHLTVILGACELAATTDLSPEAEANLAVIRNSALMIARLAKGLEPLKH